MDILVNLQIKKGKTLVSFTHTEMDGTVFPTVGDEVEYLDEHDETQSGD